MEDGVTEAKLIEEGKALQKQVDEWVFRLKTHDGPDGSQPPLDQDHIFFGAMEIENGFGRVMFGIHQPAAEPA